MFETGVTRTEIVNQLSISVHGSLRDYVPVIAESCVQDPEFLAHLIAWDFVNGQVKDSKLALPVLTIWSRQFPEELLENSLAHLALASPRELLRALRFSLDLGVAARRQRLLERLVRAYLKHHELIRGKWERLAVRHRRSLHSLYALTHCPRPLWTAGALFGRVNRIDGKAIKFLLPPGTIFSDVAALRSMDPRQVAAVTEKWHLSPLVVSGALAGSSTKVSDAAVVQAAVGQMSGSELVTRVTSLEAAGLSKDPVLKEAFRAQVAKATKSKKATLKTSVAADEVEDVSLREMLRELQERQIQTQKDSGQGIDGNWLVICDKSQSQDLAIELGAHIAAAIAKFVTGRVWLVFCDTSASGDEVTGFTLEQLKAHTRYVRAGGSTSYGVGLAWALEKRLDLDGVVIVGDGGENFAPFFVHAHQEFKSRRQKDLPVYLYQTYCEPRYAASAGGNPKNFERTMYGKVPFTSFDLTHGKVDYFSVPNLVQTMSVSRFGVVEKIMACPLVSLEQVIPGMEKWHKVSTRSSTA
jgi:hypothetical protein